jgi:hypothetical protein
MGGWSRDFLERKSRTSGCVEITKLLSKNKATIIMPKDAPHIKVDATQRYDADRYAEDRNAIETDM